MSIRLWCIEYVFLNGCLVPKETFTVSFYHYLLCLPIPKLHFPGFLDTEAKSWGVECPKNPAVVPILVRPTHPSAVLRPLTVLMHVCLGFKLVLKYVKGLKNVKGTPGIYCSRIHEKRF